VVFDGYYTLLYEKERCKKKEKTVGFPIGNSGCFFLVVFMFFVFALWGRPCRANRTRCYCSLTLVHGNGLFLRLFIFAMMAFIAIHSFPPLSIFGLKKTKNSPRDELNDSV
jgi:hypothetical protein